ncbi:MAG: LytR/AlgR family response regulator transcription factor [Bacteroidia bacterium]
MRAVIIDDVANARQLLKADLEAHCPQVEVIGEADGVVAGAKLIRQVQPELVFLDVQMPDGSGFDLLDILGEVEFRIIFTTASDQHAIRALRLSAIDYLLKPLNTDELVAAVAKAAEAPQSELGVKALKENLKNSQGGHIVVNTLDKMHMEAISDIMWCEASANYTIIHLADGRDLLATKTLKDFDQMLRNVGFLRTHQSNLVNFAFVRTFIKTDGGFLQLKNGTEVPVSHRKRGQVMEHMQKIGLG